MPWAAPALALLVGGAGAGKSTLALQVAAQLSPVLLVSAEEAPGPALARRLVLAGMGKRGDVLVVRNPAVEELAAYARQGGALVVDSVTATKLQPGDLRALLSAGAELVLGTVQVTKAGQPAGTNALIHEADLVLEVQAGAWICTKTRFGPVGAQGQVRGVGRAPDPEPSLDTEPSAIPIPRAQEVPDVR